jgi:hypothetical protein
MSDMPKSKRRRSLVLERARRRLAREKIKEQRLELLSPYQSARGVLPVMKAIAVFLGIVSTLTVLVTGFIAASQVRGGLGLGATVITLVQAATVLFFFGLAWLFLFMVQASLDTADSQREVLEELRFSGERLTEIAETPFDDEDEEETEEEGSSES